LLALAFVLLFGVYVWRWRLCCGCGVVVNVLCWRWIRDNARDKRREIMRETMRWAKDNARNNTLGERNDGRGKRKPKHMRKDEVVAMRILFFVIENGYQYRLTDLIVVGSEINE